MRRLVALFLVLASSAQGETGVLEIEVRGVRSAAGHVLVAVCDQETFLKETCRYRGNAPAAPGSVVVRVTGIPAGRYAVQAYQDENDNRKIDRNLFGIPTEGIGFSNDARMRFGPPEFADAAITLGTSGGRVQLTLRFY